jgi:hypothetical protein
MKELFIDCALSHHKYLIFTLELKSLFKQIFSFLPFFFLDEKESPRSSSEAKKSRPIRLGNINKIDLTSTNIIY